MSSVLFIFMHVLLLYETLSQQSWRFNPCQVDALEDTWCFIPDREPYAYGIQKMFPPPRINHIAFPIIHIKYIQVGQKTLRGHEGLTFDRHYHQFIFKESTGRTRRYRGMKTYIRGMTSYSRGHSRIHRRRHSKYHYWSEQDFIQGLNSGRIQLRYNDRTFQYYNRQRFWINTQLNGQYMPRLSGAVRESHLAHHDFTSDYDEEMRLDAQKTFTILDASSSSSTESVFFAMVISGVALCIFCIFCGWTICHSITQVKPKHKKRKKHVHYRFEYHKLPSFVNKNDI
eukprot:201516_1